MVIIVHIQILPFVPILLALSLSFSIYLKLFLLSSLHSSGDLHIFSIPFYFLQKEFRLHVIFFFLVA